MEDANENNFQDTNIYLGFNDQIIKFDPSTRKQGKKSLDIELISFRWIIELPNNQLFCCAEKSTRRKYCKPRKASALFLVNSKSLAIIREIPFRYHVHDYKGVYYNNYVYLFGGHSAISFDIVKGKWKSLAFLPKYSFNCYCIPFKSSILLCGEEHSDVYRYNIDIESYSTLNLSLEPNKEKLLISHSETLYLIEFGGFIYESTMENQYSWAPLGIGNIYGENLQIFCVSNNFSIFIGTYSKNDDSPNYYEFQLNHKMLINMKADPNKLNS